ncbi:MAG TPA: chemotaxis response regulator protein-glutamate methylesterase [Cellvibrionaceae bacterium]
MVRPIKVLIIDDSALIRTMLREMINSDARFSVVAEAKDPFEARELIKLHDPDVLTLDVEMPRMNGITFLANLMRLRPMPVVMISTLTQEGAPATLQALELGAVDFLPKPQSGGDSALEVYRELILEKIYWASKANIIVDSPVTVISDSEKEILALTGNRNLKSGFICAIGASTGGTEAIKNVLKLLPENAPPIVIAQHIPAVFSASFARRLDSVCRINVFEAEHNQPVLPGNAYLAPGHSHLRLFKSPKGYVCRLDQADPVNRHRPSVQVLFDSMAEQVGAHSLGIMLTGMGADGADALLRMKQAGAATVAQDEATSVVWGMPGAAVKRGAVDKILPLDKIAGFIMQQAYNR